MSNMNKSGQISDFLVFSYYSYLSKQDKYQKHKKTNEKLTFVQKRTNIVRA